MRKPTWIVVDPRSGKLMPGILALNCRVRRSSGANGISRGRRPTGDAVAKAIHSPKLLLGGLALSARVGTSGLDDFFLRCFAQ
jgi:hypothetical protein